MLNFKLETTFSNSALHKRLNQRTQVFNNRKVERLRTFKLLPQDFENTSSLRGTRGKTDIFRRQDCTMDVQKESKTNQLRTREGYLFRACCIAREAAAITRVLTETQRQAEEWEAS